MSMVRALFRLLGFSAVTLSLYAIYLSGLSVLQVWKGRGRGTELWRNRMARLWATATARIMGMNIYLEGTPPEAPFFLVSNHLSYVDIIPIILHTDCVFIAKSEVKSWPVIGSMARSAGVIFIDREMKRDVQRVNRMIDAKITDRQGVVLFPEGTSTRGNEVKNFKSALLRFAARQEFPVSYATITYRTHDPDKTPSEWICWWGDMTFLDHFFNMLKLKSFDTIITFGSQRITESDRKKLADRLHQLVEQQFTPIETEIKL